MMSSLEAHWGEWTALAVYLVLLALLLVLTVIEGRNAYGREGFRLWILPLLVVPWVAIIVLGSTHPYGQSRGGPAWVGQAMGLLMFATPVLWIAALTVFIRSWRCVVPFIVFNLLTAPLAIIYGSCMWAGACF